jgi:prepilin-type N-terminal cleavage/methylation domain-containing protein
MRKRPAFTLIELLVVVAIIALLISVVMPAFSAVRRQSQSTACKSNMHQIGVGLKAYLTQNKDIFPWAKRIPDYQPQPPGQREIPAPLPVALKNELRGNGGVFECPSDRITQSDGTDPNMPPNGERYFDTVRTSYEWNSLLNGVKVNYKSVTIGAVPPNPGIKFPLKALYVVSDFEGWHRDNPDKKGSTNFLYADDRIDAP